MTLNESLKEAIVACARDEMRKLIGEIVTPIRSSLESTSFNLSLPGETRSKNSNTSSLYGKTQPRKHTHASNSCCSGKLRPRTACSLPSAATSVYEPRRTKIFNKTQCPNATIALSSQKRMINGLESPLSYSSAKWMEKSAQIVHKSSNKVCNLEATKIGNPSRIQTDGILNIGEPKVERDNHTSSRGHLDKRPKTSFHTKRTERSRINCRQPSRPSTALERRAPSRPNTARLLRAKAEGFSASLLRPICLDSPKEAPAPIPFTLGESEWENELARHILSVYNTKTVADVRNHTSSLREEIDIKPPDHSNDRAPSDFSRSFFTDTLPSPLSDKSNIKKPKNEHSRRPMTSPATSKEKIIRQTKQIMNSTTPRMVWLAGTGDVSHDWSEVEGKSMLSAKLCIG